MRSRSCIILRFAQCGRPEEGWEDGAGVGAGEGEDECPIPLPLECVPLSAPLVPPLLLPLECVPLSALLVPPLLLPLEPPRSPLDPCDGTGGGTMLRAGGGVALRVAEGAIGIRGVEEAFEVDAGIPAVALPACPLAAASVFPLSTRTSFSPKMD